MPFITVKEHLAPAMLLVVVLLLWKGGRKGRLVVALLIPTIILSDQLSAQFIKPLVSRLRPCYVFSPLENVHSFFGSKSSPSFPSAHASNAFAMATLFIGYFPRYAVIALIAAGSVAFSRIYVGVHFPVDVVAGAIVGTLCGIWIKYSFEYLKRLNGMKSGREHDIRPPV